MSATTQSQAMYAAVRGIAKDLKARKSIVSGLQRLVMMRVPLEILNKFVIKALVQDIPADEEYSDIKLMVINRIQKMEHEEQKKTVEVFAEKKKAAKRPANDSTPMEPAMKKPKTTVAAPLLTKALSQYDQFLSRQRTAPTKMDLPMKPAVPMAAPTRPSTSSQPLQKPPMRRPLPEFNFEKIRQARIQREMEKKKAGAAGVQSVKEMMEAARQQRIKEAQEKKMSEGAK